MERTRNKFTKENLEKYIPISETINEVLKHLGLSQTTANYKSFNLKVKEYNLDILHFLGKAHKKNRKDNKKYTLEEILVENSTYRNTKILKNHLVNKNLMEYKCNECGLLPEWNNKKLTLQLDHINGIHNDNRLENLRFLCPNCHSQTDTYCGKNVKNKSEELKNNEKELYFCKCGRSKQKNSKNCARCSQPCKILWPTDEELVNLLKINSYYRLSKILGVRDNTIRKRVKNRKLIID